ADAERESEIVFDPGTHSRLSAWSFALDHDRVEAFGCGINGRGEAGGTATDDDEVKKRLVGRSAQPEFTGDIRDGRLANVRAVFEHNGGETAIRWKRVQEVLNFLVIMAGFDIEPLERDAVAAEEIANFVGCR